MARTSLRQENSQTILTPIRRVNTEVFPNPTPNGIPAEDDRKGNVDDETAKPRALVRSNTDVGPRRQLLSEKDPPFATEDIWEMRHGYEEQYSSTDYLGRLRSVSEAVLRG